MPPLLGEHSVDVLTWLGYTLDDVRSLRAGPSMSPRRDDSYRHLLVTRPTTHVVTVTLNRPEQMNAMNTAMGEDILACFEALARDAEPASSSSPAPANARFAPAAISRSATA